VREGSAIVSDLVSVIICSYNNFPDIEMSIQSALRQSYPSIEVIVVDNSSTDSTLNEVAARFGPLVQYLTQANRECAGAYNAGFALSRGEFIQFMDGDDVLAPNKVEKQVQLFRENPTLDIAYGEVRGFQTKSGVATWRDCNIGPETDMLRSLTVHPQNGKWLNTLGVLFRRRALERVGAWDEAMYVEDLDYWVRAAWAGCSFGYCAQVPMGFARSRDGQKTRNALAMARGAEAVWDKALRYITKEPYRSFVQARLAQARLRIAVLSKQRGRREALSMLARARATSRRGVSAINYLLGCAKIVLPELLRGARAPSE
jgi:glycosyltransferase involved in cell wall biosynthesis